MDEYYKQCMWHISRDLWRKGTVTSFLEEQVMGLRDENGNPLPEHAKKFILDILFQEIRAPRKTRKFLFSEYAVKKAFEARLRFFKLKNLVEPKNGMQTETPKDAALARTADDFHLSESIISETIYPRSRRKKKK
jgi:hypothetical protein